MRRRNLTIFPLIIAALIAAWQYFGAEKVVIPETGRVARVGLSTEQESAIGLQSYREVVSQSDLLTSGSEYDAVMRVARRLTAVVGENAGLAAVMGHEMAHAVARHGSQRILQNDVTQTVMTGASLSFSEMDWNQRRMVLAALGAGAQFGVLLPFSRKHETEADELGLIYMARAGYDPAEAIAFWQRMAEAGGDQAPEFASTHPSHGSRIDHLRQLLPQVQAEYEKGTAAQTTSRLSPAKS
jgi:metalloendopeptidase OMA1, mitochondrial